MYFNGWGVPADRVEAIAWYLKASDHGDEPAKEALKSLGVPSGLGQEPARDRFGGRELLVSAEVDFSREALGTLAANGLVASGIARIETAEGSVVIAEKNSNMVLPDDRSRVLMLTGTGLQTSLRIRFVRPLSGVGLTCIGVSGGASLPKWRLQALDARGHVLDSTGEDEFAIDVPIRSFSVKGDGITEVVLTTDNRLSDQQAWATYSSLPLVGMGLRATAD